MSIINREIFLRIGLFFGNLIIYILEKAFPSFKNKNQNLHGFKNYYLTKYNLTNKENFKRNFKLGIVISTSIIFWVYFTFLLNNLFYISNITLHINLLIATLIISIILILSSLYVSYKLSKE